MAGHGSRFWLLAASALLLALFTAPASQLLNEFLRDEEGFTGAADHRVQHPHQHPRRDRAGDRRPAGRHTRAPRRSARSAWRRARCLTVAMVLLGGWPMWGLSVAAAVTGAMVVPALGVYGPELFPTSLRGRANGTIAILGVTGQRDRAPGRRRAVGASGTASGPALAVLAIGPLLMAVLVLVAYPETAHRELEELNPEDRIGPPGAIPSGEQAPVD